MTVNNFLENVSESLNDAETDYEFTHWGKAYLLSLLNEAIVLISIYRPDEFTEAKIIKLAPGTFQNADCCKKVYKLYTQTDKWGNEIGPALMKVANKVADLWTKVACPPDKIRLGLLVTQLRIMLVPCSRSVLLSLPIKMSMLKHLA